MLTADQFLGRDDGLLQQRRKHSHVCRKTRTFPLILRRNQSLPTKATKSKKLRIRNGILDTAWLSG